MIRRTCQLMNYQAVGLAFALLRILSKNTQYGE